MMGRTRRETTATTSEKRCSPLFFPFLSFLFPFSFDVAQHALMRFTDEDMALSQETVLLHGPEARMIHLVPSREGLHCILIISGTQTHASLPRSIGFAFPLSCIIRVHYTCVLYTLLFLSSFLWLGDVRSGGSVSEVAAVCGLLRRTSSQKSRFCPADGWIWICICQSRRIVVTFSSFHLQV